MSYFGFLLYQALEIYSFIIIAAIIISWLITFNVLSMSHDITRKLVSVLGRLTDPVLHPIQRIVPSIGGIDLSPIIVIFGIMLLQRLVYQLFILPSMAI
jgi:YggT family protein